MALAAASALAQAAPAANTAKIFNGYALTDPTAAGLLYNAQANAPYRMAFGPVVKEPWPAKLDGPSRDHRPVHVARADFMPGRSCKNHDCYDHTIRAQPQ